MTSHRLPPSALELEITETATMDDPAAVARVVKALKRMGVTVALDDFGTGQSSLSHLRHLGATTVKVDRSFVSGIGDDAADRSLVEGMIRLAHELDLCVVAEGVEIEEQRVILADAQCDSLQGYLLGRPMSKADLVASIIRASAQPEAA